MGFGIYIRNKGVGPAIIKDFKIFVDNKEINSTRQNLWMEAVKVLNINYTFVQMFLFNNDASMSTDEKRPLFIADKSIDKNQEKIFKEELKRINIYIKYESIYKQKFITRLNDI